VHLTDKKKTLEAHTKKPIYDEKGNIIRLITTNIFKTINMADADPDPHWVAWITVGSESALNN
jgi:hypothetical protein